MLGAAAEPVDPVAPAEVPTVDEAVVAEVAAALETLTPQQLLFVEAYVGTAKFSAAAAYQAAYPGCKYDSARSNGPKLLANDRVSAEIARRLAERVQRGRIMSGDEALERMTSFAEADIADLMPEGHRLRELPPEVRRRIKKIRNTKYGLELELYDAMHATEVLAKASGKFVQRHDIKVSRSLEDILSEANGIEAGSPALLEAAL